MLGEKSKQLWITFLAFVCISLSQVTWADEGDLKAELDEYIKVFSQDDFNQQKAFIDKLAWAGISAPSLYDIIESKVQSGFHREDKPGIEEISRYVKTLALSGNKKYRTTLIMVLEGAESKKIRKHTKTALARLEQYIEWNPVITKNLGAAPKGQLEETRVSNMLNADDAGLVRIGAKRVYYVYGKNAPLLDLAKQRLLKDYQAAEGKIEVDAVAWLCKALANSGNSEYRATLDKVAITASNRKVAKYAKKYASYL